ncbi:hypothetical protein ABZY16_25140 [Streptomyces sp. NPDC006553]|uniref:hypothetical protein n=1 Tax=Streptomyces sp. NPDC006553 TaxID=3157180 RepID=UPI0033AA5929
MPGGGPSALPERDATTLAVLPDGAVAVSSKPGSTHLLSPDLDEVLASWPMFWGWEKQHGPEDDPFAASISVTPSGRLLCMTSEYGLGNWAGAHTNIVAVSEPGTALGPGDKPLLRAIATLDARTDCQSGADSYAHVRYGDEPVGRGNRPSPSLTEALSELTGTSGSLCGSLDSKMTRPAALGDDLFVVPVFGKTYRSSNRGQEFGFALVGDRGVLQGRLGGLHLREDSPFTGFDFTVVADPYRARAFHLKRYGLYAWSADGVLRARMSTAEKPFKPLVHFALLECTPAGELLLAHRRQHLLLRVQVSQDLDDLAVAVEAALKGYGRERTARKKQYAPVNWLWSDSAATVILSDEPSSWLSRPAPWGCRFLRACSSSVSPRRPGRLDGTPKRAAVSTRQAARGAVDARGVLRRHPHPPRRSARPSLRGDERVTVRGCLRLLVVARSGWSVSERKQVPASLRLPCVAPAGEPSQSRATTGV